MGTLAEVPGICGRAAEIGALTEVLDRVGSGSSAVVLLEGEAGIGKTRLLQNTLDDARGRGMQVAAGMAEELERTRPFSLLARALECESSSDDPRRAAIAALLASQAGGDHRPMTVTSDPGLRFRVVDAFTDLIEELALSGPLVVGVDDLQWADPSSLLTLAAVNRRMRYLPVALIGCLRPRPRDADLDALIRTLEAAGGRCLWLDALSAEAVRDLIADVVSAEPGPGLLAGMSGAAGNPLFVTELLWALVREGAVEIADGRAETASVTLPATLRLTILRRLSFLPGETLQALRSASILGSRFTLTDLATVTGRAALGLSEALSEAIGARVVDDDGTCLRFRHDLIRGSIYEDLPPTVRRGLHREAGQRLAKSGAPALQVAEHLGRAAVTGDAEAIEWITTAARQAAATSPDICAGLLSRAVGFLEFSDPRRDSMLAEQAVSLIWAGHPSDAARICRGLCHLLACAGQRAQLRCTRLCSLPGPGRPQQLDPARPGGCCQGRTACAGGTSGRSAS